MAKTWLENESTISCDNAILSQGFAMIPMIVLSDGDLSPGGKVIYQGLLWYKWRGQDYPGHEQAAEDFGLSRVSVNRYMKDLEERGLVQSHRPGLGQPNTYHLPDPNAVIKGLLAEVPN